MHSLDTSATALTKASLGSGALAGAGLSSSSVHLAAVNRQRLRLKRWLAGLVVCVAAAACSDDASSNGDEPARDDQDETKGPTRSELDGRTNGDAGEDDLPASDEDATRGSEVPSTWGEYCQDIAAIWCEREQDCPDGVADKCETAFMLGCCEQNSICGASFGEGVSNAEYEACLTDAVNDECGADAPESCRMLVTDPPQPGAPSDSLAAVCLESCEAQSAVGCAGGTSVSECLYSCIIIPDFIPGCDDAWIDLNACMATAPLMCDKVSGGASVGYDDCGTEIDAFGSCQAG